MLCLIEQTHDQDIVNNQHNIDKQQKEGVEIHSINRKICKSAKHCRKDQQQQILNTDMSTGSILQIKKFKHKRKHQNTGTHGYVCIGRIQQTDHDQIENILQIHKTVKNEKPVPERKPGQDRFQDKKNNRSDQQPQIIQRGAPDIQTEYNTSEGNQKSIQDPMEL